MSFPKATVTGSDLSGPSLELSAGTARELGITNLTLKQESINYVPYKDQFDYVICTGVIHHNADPAATLKKLAAALKPTGILELMVYSRYERLPTTAFQKAIRILCGNQEQPDFDLDLSTAKRLIGEIRLKNFTILNQSHIDDYPEEMLADVLIQPVENSYTVESLEDLAASCNLELVAPCVNMFDQAQENVSWNMEFANPDLQALYDALPDSQRWQVTNHLLFENSPLLWFYLQRKDSSRERRSEQQICQQFLDTKFVRSRTVRRSFIRTDDKYELSPNNSQFPHPPTDNLSRKIVETVDAMGPETPMRDVLQSLGIENTWRTVNKIRIGLTTSTYPYLKSIPDAEDETARQQRINDEKKLEESSLQKLRQIRRRPVTS